MCPDIVKFMAMVQNHCFRYLIDSASTFLSGVPCGWCHDLLLGGLQCLVVPLFVLDTHMLHRALFTVSRPLKSFCSVSLKSYFCDQENALRGSIRIRYGGILK